MSAYVLSHFCLVQLFATPWIVVGQTSLSMGFPRQEYWSGFLPQGIFLTEESNLRLLHWQADYLPLVPPGKLIWHIDPMNWSINIAKKTNKKLITSA